MKAHNPEENILERIFTVNNKLGLHARPAASLVQICKQFKCQVTIRKGKNKVDGKSIMGLMTLAAGTGTKITVTCEGTDAQEAMKKIAQLFEDKFGEEE